MTEGTAFGNEAGDVFGGVQPLQGRSAERNEGRRLTTFSARKGGKEQGEKFLKHEQGIL